jgi:two-component system CheB/CheR fusion protein
MSNAPLDILLEYLQRTRGFDFTGYKRSTLERRIRKRMAEVHCESYVDYLDFLEVQPDEFSLLFNTILINVTGFFRDGPTWDYLASDALPALIESIGDGDPIRVWCAGCASGEETYTIAILLAEALGEQGYVERVKIYATDVDEQALDIARHAVYSVKDVEAIPREVLERYFERTDGRYVFRKDLRRAVIFGRNDLVQDAPISRIDLLTCRNTLMYFNAETQERILGRFNFALNDRGLLVLGKSEMLITHSDLFAPVSLKRRVFRKVARQQPLRDRLLAVAQQRHPAEPPERATALRDGALDAGLTAQIAVDAAGTLVMANRRARELFRLGPGDIGRPLKDLELSYRPVELRSHIDAALEQRRAVVVDATGVAVAVGDIRDLEVHVRPVRVGGDEEALLGATVIFADLTQQRRLREELETSKRELETAYEELQSTIEELETTNEELQSTNEELETTNEELQSTNEELETMNEELHSTNEELATMNDELRLRTGEINEVNTFLEAILTALRVGVVVVDKDQLVQVWNAQSADLWGLRPDEVEGRHLMGLDIGLPLEHVKPILVDVLAGREDGMEVDVPARDRRGRDITCRVSCIPMRDGEAEISGAIVLVEEVVAEVADGTQAAERLR